MKVALVQPPHWQRRTPPLALASLSSFLKLRGHESSIFDFNCDLYHAVDSEDKKIWGNENAYFWQNAGLVRSLCAKYSGVLDDFISRILEPKPRMVGFTVHFSSVVMTLALARLLKQRAGDVIIVAGGPQCGRTYSGMSLIADDAIDYVIVGEGETALAALADMGGKIIPDRAAKGTLFKWNGRTIDSGGQETISDINALPFPDFSAFSLSGYETDDCLPFSFSRGCIYRCVFCNVHMLSSRFRSFSAQWVFENIVYQKQRHEKFNTAVFCDSITNGDMKQLSLFCDMLIDAKKTRPEMRDFIWQATHFAIRRELTDEMAEKMSRSGCRAVGFGMESGSDSVLRVMRKRQDARTAAEVFRRLHGAGIRVSAGFIVGFPTETEEDFNATLDFIKENGAYIDHITASETSFTIDTGTIIQENPAAFSVFPDPDVLYWKSSGGNDYPRRMERLKKFNDYARRIKGDNNVFSYGAEKLFYKNLFDYYTHIGEHQKALCYHKKLSLA